MQDFIRYKWLTLVVFALLIAFSAIALPNVPVNYDIMSYLPESSPSTKAISEMEGAFGALGEETRIMAKVSSIPQALDLKARIENIELAEEVKWLDDVADILQPESFIKQSVLDAWYKDGYALYQARFENGASNKTLLATADELREALGSDVKFSGGELGDAVLKNDAGTQSSQMMLFLLPVVLLIMIFSTRSWLEPLLFIGVIGISILVNMGTNIFMGEISFVSQTTAAALQLAVSMDYSIFLLHTFAIHRDKGKEPVEAMQAAIKQARPSILASAATTFCGFLALTIMRFGIGADLGIVLAKGVFVSLVTVLFLLPVATIMCCGLLEKFQHRALMPSFKGFANVVVKIGVPVTIILVLLIVPAYLAQSKNTFVYMASETNDDTIAIQERFGSGEQLFVLVPEGNHLKEMNLAQDLADLPQIDSVTSRASSVGFEIPFESLPKDTRDLLQSGGYSRMIISAEEIGFSLVAQIRTLVEASYGQSYHLGGTAASLSDMKDTLSEDNKLTGLVSILAISLIVLLTFRSPVLLILLVGAIEVSIWINLSVPYFTGNDVTFFGYMIISSVQLGATVDYAILFGSRYLEKRRTIGKLEAAKESLSETTGSILTSALILFGAGMIISTISMDEMASELGDLLGRGALLSAAMVLVILPNAFRLCDGAIRRLTFKSNFLEDKLQ